METLLVVITNALLLYALILAVRAQSRCPPAELGEVYQTQSPSIRGSALKGFVGWKISNDDYCRCNYFNLLCSCVGKVGYSATISYNTGTEYVSTFTVDNQNVTLALNTKKLECVDAADGRNESTVFSCLLSVYERPGDVTCELQALTSGSNQYVTVKCETKSIHPGAVCLFYKMTNQTSTTYLSQGNDVTIVVSPEGKSCTLTVAGRSTDLGMGDHQFGAVMYPNVTGDVTDEKYGKTSSNTTRIQIGYPSAEPERRNCPTVVSGDPIRNGYIRDGTEARCTCARTDQTYFPVTIRWKNNNGGPVVSSVNQQDETTTLNFTATKDQNFSCIVNNSLQWSKEVTYVPQVAYGPSSRDVTLEPSSLGPLDLCQAGDETFTVQCQVSPSSVVPNATFSYTVNTTSSVVPQTPASGSTNTATVTVTQGETYGVYFVVKNSVFQAIQAEKSVSVVVRERPSAPIIEIFQSRKVSPISGTLTVEEGGANVTCHVTGGYPQVTKLRLSCGEDKTVTNTNTQTQNVTFTRNMNGWSCFCVATHDSRCYSSNTTTYMLDVQYPPAVKSFNVTNIGNGTIENGTILAFNCEAEGNPGPELSLQHAGVAVTDVTTDGDTTERRLRHNQTMDCLDTGVYTCTAQAQGKENSSKVEVFVLCPQQLASSQSQNTVYDRKINSTFDINVTVYGYPKPTSPLQLHGHKEDLQKADYSVTYTETRPPLGNVTLTFYSLTEKYFQNYTLTVTNTKGSLEYNFSISGYVASPSKGSDDLNAAAIGGGIAAAVVVILIIVLVVFIVRKKVNPCARKGDSSRKAGQDEEHVIPNDLYSGANSGEVVIDNSDLYSGNWNRKSNEVVIDNSDLYSGFSKPGSNEVVVDNSALYGKSDDFKETREALYKNYTDVTPSMTSATAVPVDMKAFNGAKQGGNSSYEDVEVGAKSSGPSVQPKPKVAVKPMTAAKPTPAPKPGGPSTSGPQGAIVLQDDGVDQTYASVVKPVKPQAPKPQPASQRESDYFPDQSKKPEVPEKKYEQEESLTGQEGKKKEQKSGGDKKKKNKKADEIPMVPKGGAAASSSHDNPYVNGGYAEDDGNVYANATGNKSRKD